MARSFNGTSELITPSSLPTFLSAMTFSCWYNFSGSPGAFPNRYAFIVLSANASADINYYIFADNTPRFVFQFTTASNTFQSSLANHSFDTGVWHHLALVAVFATTIQFYLDGVAITTTAATGTPENISYTDRFIGSLSVNFNDPLKGNLADMALWNAQLSAGEVKSLSQGARPYTIRSGSLKAYYPLDGLQSPEIDLSGFTQEGTLTGTALAADPPVTPFTPRWGRFVGWTPILPASGLGWIINRRNKLMVPKKRA